MKFIVTKQHLSGGLKYSLMEKDSYGYYLFVAEFASFEYAIKVANLLNEQEEA